MQHNGKLGILAIDDHKFFLRGFAESFSNLSFVSEVRTCTTLSALTAALAERVPDIVFLDLNMPEIDGFTLCREIKQLYKNTFIAILTQYDSPQFVEKAKTCGAEAYFIKNTEPEVFVQFLHDFKDGRITDFISNVPLAAGNGNTFFKGDDFEIKQVLSPRERQVMKLLVQGKEHKEIENTLDISYETFKSHRSNILQKLQLKGVGELIIFAIKNRLAESEY